MDAIDALATTNNVKDIELGLANKEDSSKILNKFDTVMQFLVPDSAKRYFEDEVRSMFVASPSKK